MCRSKADDFSERLSAGFSLLSLEHPDDENDDEYDGPLDEESDE